jgi:hypothetical protein
MHMPKMQRFFQMCWGAALLVACDSRTQGKAPETPTSAANETTGSGGAPATGAPGKNEAGVVSHGGAWTSVVVAPWRYTNDQWGADKAQGAYEQCLLTRETPDGQQIGWTWSWPGFDPSVYAYPSATFGWKPWAGGTSTDARFPMRLGELVTLDLAYDVETEAEGAYNLGAEIWLTRAAPTSAAADPSIITHEVMFWLQHEDSQPPAGSVIDEPTLGGTRYELWKEANIGADANGQGWSILSFKTSDPRSQGQLPIHVFVEYLIDQGELSPDEYLASVEFGNELSGGSGTTWVERLEIAVGE